MLAPERHFTYRPLAVGQPFGLRPRARFELSAIAQDRGFALISDALDSVEADQRRVVTRDGAILPYDRVILALGAQPQSAVTGALTFRGPQDAMRISLALGTSAGSGGHVVFAAPTASAWTLPAYELALASDPTSKRHANQPASGGHARGSGRRTAPMTDLHIIPDVWSTWRVYEANVAAALSEHTNATEAELAARARAEERDAERVVVHDRYYRTHDATAASPAELRARARHARARQLDAVRDRAQQLNRIR